jgi:hypothetical protein
MTNNDPTDIINEENETLLSVPEAAKFLGVSPVTVWRKLGLKGTKREISCYRFGHRVLLSKERHLIPFLRQNEQRADEA